MSTGFLKSINWRSGLNRVYIVLLFLYYSYCFLLGPIIRGNEIRSRAFRMHIDGEDVESMYREAAFQNQFIALIKDLIDQPIASFIALVFIPIVLYIIPVFIILTIRWIYSGFRSV
jgi:hypothetical protein